MEESYIGVYLWTGDDTPATSYFGVDGYKLSRHSTE